MIDFKKINTLATSDMLRLHRLIVVLVISLFVFGCKTTNNEKQKKIQEKLSLVNQKNAKKHGELVVPQFIQDSNYQNFE